MSDTTPPYTFRDQLNTGAYRVGDQVQLVIDGHPVDPMEFAAFASSIARDLAAARAEASELRSALVHWGEHRLDCAYRAKYANRMAPPECGCGLAAALADAPQRTPAGSQTACGAEGEGT